MRLVIVDTNVPIAANSESAFSLDCAARCIDAILRVTRGEARIALDDGGRIVDEYSNKLLPGVQGVGHEFLKWVYNNQWDETYCEQIHITPVLSSADDCDFEEFPDDQALAEFDRSDRKFVAVSAAHASHPPILEAADAKWVGWAQALAEVGITVEFLCEHEIQSKYEEHFAPARTKPEKDKRAEKSKRGDRG